MIYWSDSRTEKKIINHKWSGQQKETIKEKNKDKNGKKITQS